MWTVFLTLLMLTLSRCTVVQNNETKTVNVGEAVTLLCPRDVSWSSTQLFWFRIVSGALPEVLGGTFSFDDTDVNKTPQWTTKQEPGAFVVILDETQLNDTGLYFCVRQKQAKATLLKGVFLRVKEPGPDIDTVIKDISSDPARPWDSKTLHCSVLYDRNNKSCPGKHEVFWFRAGSDETRPRFIYTHGNRSDGCEKSSEDPSLQKCSYSFSETLSSSDEETFYCAVAACGEVLFGNGHGQRTKPTVEGNNKCITDIALFVLAAPLGICLIVNVLLIYIIKTKSSHQTDEYLHRNTEKLRADQQNQQVRNRKKYKESSSAQKTQQTDVETKVLSVAVFTLREGVRGAVQRERIYAAVKAFGLD